MSDLFRSARGQELEHPDEERKKHPPFRATVFHPTEIEKPPRRINADIGDQYQEFLDKYDDLARFIDGFTEQDLAYYFREKARDAGYKYHIANMKRDRGIYKNLMKTYSVREIALMIEFIFFSPQNYLDTAHTQPTVLASSMVNRIYTDAVMWANDEYVPSDTQPKKKLKVKREWKNTNPEETKSKIGEW